MRHVVTLVLPDTANLSDQDRLAEGLQELASVDIAEAFSWGPDLRLRDGPPALAVVADFIDERQFRQYIAHDSHVRFVDEFVVPLGASVTSVQYQP